MHQTQDIASSCQLRSSLEQYASSASLQYVSPDDLSRIERECWEVMSSLEKDLQRHKLHISELFLSYQTKQLLSARSSRNFCCDTAVAEASISWKKALDEEQTKGARLQEQCQMLKDINSVCDKQNYEEIRLSFDKLSSCTKGGGGGSFMEISQDRAMLIKTIELQRLRILDNERIMLQMEGDLQNVKDRVAIDKKAQPRSTTPPPQPAAVISTSTVSVTVTAAAPLTATYNTTTARKIQSSQTINENNTKRRSQTGGLPKQKTTANESHLQDSNSKISPFESKQQQQPMSESLRTSDSQPLIGTRSNSAKEFQDKHKLANQFVNSINNNSSKNPLIYSPHVIGAKPSICNSSNGSIGGPKQSSFNTDSRNYLNRTNNISQIGGSTSSASKRLNHISEQQMKDKLLAKIYNIGMVVDDELIETPAILIAQTLPQRTRGGGSGSNKKKKPTSPVRSPFRQSNSSLNTATGQIVNSGYPSSVLDSITSSTKGIDRSLHIFKKFKTSVDQISQQV